MATRAIDGENQALFEIAPTAEGGARLSFTGRWLVGCGMPGAEELIAALAAKGASRRVTLDGQQLVAWDTGFLTVVDRLARLGKAGNLEVDSSGLPDGANRLLQLAGSVPERAGARRDDSSAPLVERVGKRSIALLEGGSEVAGVHRCGHSRLRQHPARAPRLPPQRLPAGRAGGGRPGAADRQPGELSGRLRSWPFWVPFSCSSSGRRSSSPTSSPSAWRATWRR